MDTVCWNITVSSDIDKSMRELIAEQGGDSKNDLSFFVEKIVRTYIFDDAIRQAKAATAGMDENELDAIIDEAVQWARRH
jgi:D-Tyr-tRNAtyr deacylase